MDQTIAQIKLQHEKEKQQLITDFLKRIDILLQCNVQKYPDGENWKEIILKYEKQRQNELYELKSHLETLQRSFISTQDIEFIAQKRAYESRIQELQGQQSPDDINDLYDTIEYQRNVILELEDENAFLQNEKLQQDRYIGYLTQQIDQMKQIKFSPKPEQKKYIKPEVQEAIEEMKRDRDKDIFSNRERNTVKQRESNRQFWSSKYSQRSNNEKNIQDRPSVLKSPDKQQNKELINTIEQLDEVKYKYQTALNNILRLETQVVQKLEQDEIVIE